MAGVARAVRDAGARYWALTFGKNDLSAVGIIKIAPRDPMHRPSRREAQVMIYVPRKF